jgi:hypothetical protein
MEPRDILTFTVSEGEIHDLMRAWCGEQPLAPAGWAPRVPIDRARRVFVPCWAFRASMRCWWDAQAGYSMAGRRFGGLGSARRPWPRQTLWETAQGVIDHVFDPVLVPAIKGLPLDLFQQLDPWPTDAFVPCHAAMLAGAVVETPRIPAVAAARLARREMTRQARLLCERQTPGDTFRFLHIDPRFEAERCELVLLPVWLLEYRFGGRPLQIIANGRTGRVAGMTPTTSWKTVAVAAVLFALITATVLALR